MSDLTKDRSARVVTELQAALAHRIDRLERENRDLRRKAPIVVVALACVVALVTTALLPAGSRAADSIEARRFILRGDDGRVRATLATADDGSARLVLQDREGRERLKLTLLDDGSPGLSFVDREGRPRAVLGLLSDETSTLVFADRAGRSRTAIGLSPDESSTLVFADSDGQTRAGIGLDSEGLAAFTLFEDAGPPIAPEEATPAAPAQEPS